MPQTAKITDIKWDYYPRANHSQKQVDLYRSSIEKLPPIEINKNMVGIDGYHRCQAFRQEGLEEIPVKIENIADEDVLVESIRRNASHGLQLANSDKRRLGAQLYPQLKIDEIAELLSVHRSSVLNWTKTKREEERNEEDRTIWDMWLACATQEEIAGTLGVEQKTISNRLSKLQKSIGITTPDLLKTFNIWEFNNCDERFGIKYDGRIPGQIVEHLLHYYTEPFDVVWDLFGGGGVTVDVCKHTARRYRVFDIGPIRDDIMQHDATTGLPVLKPKPDIIFLDPPYWKQKRGKWTSGETNLVNMPLDVFHSSLEKIVRGCMERAKYTALIIGATQHEHEFVDHSAEIMSRIGAPYQRIIVPYTTQQYGGAHIIRAKEGKYMLNLHRDLMIWAQ